MRPDAFWLDFKLGLRMLRRHRGITAVAMLALGVAIGLGAAWFDFTRDLLTPSLPLEDADRIVLLRNWDAERAARDAPSLHDYESWRARLRSVEGLSAASTQDVGLLTDDQRSASVSAARMTASGFGVARVRPALGRALLPDDERADAPPVVVLGHDLWQRLYDGDPGALGRTLRVGGTVATVVGVMPEGFGFPVNQELWTAFQADALDYPRGEGPRVLTFGRLAEGVTLEEARAELAVLGRQAAAEFPESNQHLRPQVDRYSQGFLGGGPLLLSAANLPFLFLLLVICANVATLVFARTVARHRELVTRSALGASRGRLIFQLFAEALALTAVAAGLGLAAAGWGMARGMAIFWEVQGNRPPFWVNAGLAPSTVAYALGLAVLSAALVGVVPALKVTGRNLRDGLSGAARLRFGRASTTVIVVQVALCMIFLPIAFARATDALGGRIERTGFPAGQFVSGHLARQPEVPVEELPAAERDAFQARSAALLDEVRRRLAEEPGVAGVAFASRVPGMNHPYRSVQLDRGAATPDSAPLYAARALAVDLSFFELMEAPVVAGRGFRPSDFESDLEVAVVDRTFVREYLGGRNPVGQRLRYPARAGDDDQRWYEIVGVVDDLAMNAYGPGGYQDIVQLGPAGYVGVYHPLRAEDASDAQLFLRAETGEADALVPRIEAAITALDGSLAVDGLMPVDQLWAPAHRGERLLTWVVALLAGMVVALSATGIYALIAFTVSQRTREIGIRAALGAAPRRIVLALVSRTVLQVGLGVVAGALVIGLLAAFQTPAHTWLVAAMAALMMTVALVASLVPARRALRIQPTEALRADG